MVARLRSVQSGRNTLPLARASRSVSVANGGFHTRRHLLQFLMLPGRKRQHGDSERRRDGRDRGDGEQEATEARPRRRWSTGWLAKLDFAPLMTVLIRTCRRG